MYLTLEDPRARIQGSRDPLGVLPVWSDSGRKVVTNLTTQTTSVRGFSILLLGRYYGERLVADRIIDETSALDVFLRMEQIGAYVRYVAHGVEEDIRGIERVKRFKEEYKGRPPIEPDATGMILSDQRMYGLWGLYSVSARLSGLLQDGPVGLTPLARDFVEATYTPRVRPVENLLTRLLVQGGRLKTSRQDRLFSALSEVLDEKMAPSEAAFYGVVLRDAQHVKEVPAKRQRLFARLLREHSDLSGPVGRTELLDLAEQAHLEDGALSDRLKKIANLEAFLAPSEALFELLEVRHRQRPQALSRHLHDTWGGSVPNLDRGAFEEILPEIRAKVGPEIATQIDRCHRALAVGEYTEAILAELEWNKEVMGRRHAAPWVTLSPEGRLDVRYRATERELPDREEIHTLWRNDYFIGSLKRITATLEEGSR